MTTSYFTIERIRRVLIIALISAFSVFLLGLFDNTKFDNAVIHLLTGFFAGILVGYLEEFVVIKSFKHFNLFWTTLIKGTLYTLGASLLLYLFTNLLLNLKIISTDTYENFMGNGEYLKSVFYILFVTDFIVVFNQYQKFLGNNLLFWYAYGKYQKPEHEERIFMFLDISSSTTLAEQMKPDLYFEFINEFYHDISEPLLRTSASIYQYVGDEVVFTWKMKQGIKSNNCINLFFDIENKIEVKREIYLKKYGHIPEFKAGIHCGKIIAAVVGDIKKELIYNGDVINTASRIRSFCNEAGKKLLVSAELISKLNNLDKQYKIESLGIPKLKGKHNMVAIFSVEGIN